ncbi:glycosyltransferase family 1 protein [Dyadobacter sp. CY356]|uniref:glycosyltransferase family 1 protein n=1 Tax=Dyadobacter sp. CY356 TaxID=2906442 RepID=UPI001F1B734F|nr:glycosyltransferase family 1 protein [Dyadobacter sp. CY356]MCF0059656.1 glycosyltransferase family 1 protein [Dyadobacter sp. CY356]
MIKLPKNLLCFSHLRWDFVYQRPQHLMTRFSEFSAVYYLEEPIFGSYDHAFMSFSERQPNLWVCVPHLPHGLDKAEINKELKYLLNIFFVNRDTKDFMFWYYTPMALEFSYKFVPGLTVYDCMDELSAFKFAPDELKDLERRLFNKADVVFTGGQSLYEAKKHQHYNIHPFQSSIDKKHFAKARSKDAEPADQAAIAGPKLGFYGVIDERFDTDLIKNIADARPDWQIMLIGPVVKIDPAGLPKNKNIHYLGSRNYDELPLYLSGWDVALVPFLLNESTRFISPTKTPEYLAGGKPVVSSAIRDVVTPYAKNKLVSIGVDADDFVIAIDALLAKPENEAWLTKVDEFLADNCWDNTFQSMMGIMASTLESKIAPVLLAGE